jgi:hypothetical protein
MKPETREALRSWALFYAMSFVNIWVWTRVLQALYAAIAG